MRTFYICKIRIGKEQISESSKSKQKAGASLAAFENACIEIRKNTVLDSIRSKTLEEHQENETDLPMDVDG